MGEKVEVGGSDRNLRIGEFNRQVLYQFRRVELRRMSVSHRQEVLDVFVVTRQLRNNGDFVHGGVGVKERFEEMSVPMCRKVRKLTSGSITA